MNKKFWISAIAVVSILSSGLLLGTSPPIALAQPGHDPLQPTYLYFDPKIGGIIDVATTSAHEKDPVVMECTGGNYLVVYVKDGDIYGQRLDADGVLLGAPFAIYEPTSAYASSDPDASCLFYQSAIVVVWTYDYYGNGSDMDVYAQAVHAAHQTSGSQLIGDLLWVASDIYLETRPAISCNELDDTCLVAFEYFSAGNGDIRAQRLKIASNDLVTDGDVFTVSADSAAEGYPDVVWGSQEDQFLVAFESVYHAPSSDYDRILYQQVHDTEQGAGVDELIDGSYYLITPGAYSGQFDSEQSYPAVAYNPETGRYLVSFLRHDGTVVVVALLPGVGSGDPRLVNNYAYEELAVVYSGMTDASVSAVDEFNVVYLRSTYVGEHAVYTTLLPDTSIVGDGMIVSSLDEMVDTDGSISCVDVTGSWYTGKYLAVWEEETFAGSGDFNIYAQRIGNFLQIFLPLVVK